MLKREALKLLADLSSDTGLGFPRASWTHLTHVCREPYSCMSYLCISSWVQESCKHALWALHAQPNSLRMQFAALICAPGWTSPNNMASSWSVGLAWASSSAPRLYQLSHLVLLLADWRLVDPMVYLTPFLSLIKASDVSGPITGAAAVALQRILNSELISEWGVWGSSGVAETAGGFAEGYVQGGLPCTCALWQAWPGTQVAGQHLTRSS